jgi:hypothetical protein
MSEPSEIARKDDLSLQIATTRRTLLKAIKEGRERPRWWDLVTIVLPILLGLYVWNVQATIQKKIDDQAKNLTTRLSLTEEFYKRQLTVHEKIVDKMSALLEAQRTARLHKALGTERNLHKAIREYYDSYNTPKLYVSPKLLEELGGLWSEIAPNDPEQVNDAAVRKRVEAILNQMSQDANVEEIRSLTRTLWSEGS